MGSIGIMLRASAEAKDLANSWVPTPLGPRELVEEAVAEALSDLSGLHLSANIESVEESADPRSITFSGVWGKEEIEALKRLCLRFEARFYDAEECAFIWL